MRIDPAKCVGCKQCLYICPVSAISFNEKTKKAEIDYERCTECSSCYRKKVCKFDAFYQEELKWPRKIRAILSDVMVEYEGTGVAGRGTEEMKTNDVTGRFNHGFSGVAIEFGRPGIGTSFRDVEKVTKALVEHDIKFEAKNPVTSLIENFETGELKKEILDEYVISAIIEILVKNEDLIDVINTVKSKEKDLNTVFSLCVACIAEKDGSVAAKELLLQNNISFRPNGKTNVGLGRPKYNFERLGD